MVKKLTKHEGELVLVIDKSILDSLGIDEKTTLEILILGGNLIIKPRATKKSTKKKKAVLEDSAKNIMDKYGPVFKKLAKT